MKRTVLLLTAAWCLASGAARAQAPETVQPLAAPAGPAAAAKAEPTGAPVALNQIAIRVGGEIITATEIEEPLRQLRERIGGQFRGAELEKKMQQARTEHLKRLVEEKLLLLEAKAQKLEVSDAQVEDRAKQELDALRAQFPSEEEYEKQLAAEHLTAQDLHDQRVDLTRDSLLRQRLLQSKFQEFTSGSDLTETQLQAYYDGHRDEFKRPARVDLLQVFVARPDPGLSAAAFSKLDQAARAKIDAALAELKSGRDFGAVARKYSEHRATAEKGGAVGWISQGETGMPDFDREVFDRLQAGQVSSVIATGRGFFVVRVADRQAGGQTPFEEVKGRIRQSLMAQGSETRYQAWIETLKAKYPVVSSK